MTQRRSLIDGLKPPTDVPPNREQEFVYGEKSPPEPTPEPPVRAVPQGRSPLSTRIRSDFAAALKRASLERQLAGTEPHTLQDILEQAIEPWLKANGYL